MQMGHNSQTAPTLGRRPSTITATRGPPTLTAVTACTSTTIRISAARSAPLSVSAKRDISMINQRIRARRAAVVINILVREAIKLEVAENHVAENTRLVLALVDINGATEVLVPSKTLVWKAHSLAIFLIAI